MGGSGGRKLPEEEDQMSNGAEVAEGWEPVRIVDCLEWLEERNSARSVLGTKSGMFVGIKSGLELAASSGFTYVSASQVDENFF